MRIISIGLVGLSFGGCAFEENLRQSDLTGKVRIPLEALESFQLIDPDGTPIVDGGFTLDEDGQPVLDITDQMGLLGPVYVGAFPSVEVLNSAVVRAPEVPPERTPSARG